MLHPEFRDAVVLVTGASSGIGRSIALRLARSGALLALAARDATRLEATAAACREAGAHLGVEAVAIPGDVAVQADCERIVAETVRTFGRLDMLVNNAGVSMWARFDALADLAPLERIMRVNYFGSVYCTHFALPHLVRVRGRIVGVSSLTGKAGVPTRSGYAASKHAMAGFFDSLRIELAPLGVSVTMAYPGYVRTDIRTSAFGADGRPLGTSPVHEEEVMDPEDCAARILSAAASRRREVVMTWRGRVGQWLRLVAPTFVDRIAERAVVEGR